MSEGCEHCSPGAEIVPLVRPGSAAALLVELAERADQIASLVVVEFRRDGAGVFAETHLTEDLTHERIAYALRILGADLDRAIASAGTPK